MAIKATPKKGQGKGAASGQTQKAYNGIRQMLFRREIALGQKISYRDLAQRLGVSSTPIIQALKWLEFQGLVRHEPNRGYYMEPFSLQEVREIYEFREVVEVSLLPETIKKLDKAGVNRLKVAFDAHLKANRETYLNERLLTDIQFHMTLASLSGWKVQQRTLRNLFDLLYLKYRGKFYSARPFDVVDEEHQRIFDSVAAKDLKRARKELSHHLSMVRKHVLKSLSQIQEEMNTSEF